MFAKSPAALLRLAQKQAPYARSSRAGFSTKRNLGTVSAVARAPAVDRVPSGSSDLNHMLYMGKDSLNYEIRSGLDTKPHTIVGCRAINNGRQLEVDFADGSKYEMHTTWLKDSHPSNVGADFYRKSAADVWQLQNFTISEACLTQDGEQLSLAYAADGLGSKTEAFEAKWLHSFAPFVGKALHDKQTLPKVNGTGSMFDSRRRERKAWMKDVEIPTFDAALLKDNMDAQLSFLERMEDPGVAMITGVGVPDSLERESAGLPLGELFRDVLGKLNQHPVRSTAYGVMRKTAESARQGSDYDMGNPLSMHTDHTVYHGTPGYLQALYQAEGSVRSKVCDGLALAEYVREHHPEAFKLLTEVNMTHSSRNVLYTREGAPKNVKDTTSRGAPFELIHTHPVIVLDDEGQLQKVVQSETKRGICALPYDKHEAWLEAYGLWTSLCEDERFIKHFDWPEGTIIVTNNWRTLHGRASVPPGMARTMCFGYFNQQLVENRYRLLSQMRAQRESSLGTEWLTRVPNQVLAKIIN
jgi:alpha-ketoglutarate-dependent taurine dioxygenase